MVSYRPTRTWASSLLMSKETKGACQLLWEGGSNQCKLLCPVPSPPLSHSALLYPILCWQTLPVRAASASSLMFWQYMASQWFFDCCKTGFAARTHVPAAENIGLKVKLKCTQSWVLILVYMYVYSQYSSGIIPFHPPLWLLQQVMVVILNRFQC